MKMAELPIAVLMQRRTVAHRWADDAWAAVAVVPVPSGPAAVTPLQQGEKSACYLISGLLLELYPDENDGYFENWVAPEPKVFVLWRMQESIAMPVLASVSYAEGTRMLDSGEAADGVPMPAEIHAWLGAYLQAHYQPPSQHRKRRPAADEPAAAATCVPPAPDPSAPSAA